MIFSKITFFKKSLLFVLILSFNHFSSISVVKTYGDLKKSVFLSYFIPE